MSGLALALLLHATLSVAEPADDWQAVARAQSALAVTDDWVVGPPHPMPDCEQWLDAAEIERTPTRIPVHRSRSGSHVCGAPDAIRYRSGPGGIRWGGSPAVTCGLALAMARFETVVQQEAQRYLGSKVARIDHLGTYNCREMAAYPGWVSEHSYANAIDIRHFVLRSGRAIAVEGRCGDGSSPTNDPETMFLRAIARRAFDEDVFATVLSPAFDRLHHNHFHLDMARYRVDGTR